MNSEITAMMLVKLYSVCGTIWGTGDETGVC